MAKSSSPMDILGTLVFKAVEIGANELEVEYKDGKEWVFARKDAFGFGIASFPSAGNQAAALRQQLEAIGKRGKTIQAPATAYSLKVSTYDDFGETAYRVRIKKV